MLEALQTLKTHVRSNSSQFMPFFNSSCAPRNRTLNEIPFFCLNLDKSQREAVKFSIGPDKISLIHGPPGNLNTV